MMSSFLDQIDSHFYVNIDATTFEHEENKRGEHVFVPKERDKEKNVKKLATKAMSLFVKYYELMNAHGTTAPDLYVIGVESMGPEEFIVKKVPALSSGTHAGAFGYVVMMKKRSGNDAFFKWMFSVYIPEFIDSLRKAHNGFEEDGTTPKWAVLMLDGETKQIDLLVTDEMHTILLRHRIIVIKLGASCSSIQQACDIAKLFMSEKKSLLSIKYQTGDEDMERALVEIFNSILNMNSEKRKQYREGLVNINYAHQKATTRSIMADGWKNSGLYPFDLKKILAKCRSEQPTEVIDRIELHMPKFVKDFLEHGQVSESLMDKCDIPIYDDGTEKRKIRHDARALSQRRCSRISDYGLILARIEKEEAKVSEKERRVVKKAESHEADSGHFFAMMEHFNLGGDIENLSLEILKGAFKYITEEIRMKEGVVNRTNMPTKKSAFVEALQQLIFEKFDFLSNLYSEFIDC
jgi:hypothetical protein